MSYHALLSNLIRAALLMTLIAACTGLPAKPVEPEAGTTPQEVRDALGEPDETQEFVMPDGRFFGPQERLIGLVPAGDVVEEWRYHLAGDEVMYVWFYASSTFGEADLLVVATATLPKDAVY